MRRAQDLRLLVLMRRGGANAQKSSCLWRATDRLTQLSLLMDERIHDRQIRSEVFHLRDRFFILAMMAALGNATKTVIAVETVACQKVNQIAFCDLGVRRTSVS